MSVDLFPEKAPYGTPCNGCGLCCQNEICPLGQIVFPAAVVRFGGACPALERDDERFICGLIARPEAYAPIKASVYGVEALREAAVIGVGAGIGCDARMDGEADPPKDFLVAMLRVMRTPRSTQRRIEKLWTP